jgi:hypothetical protein
MRAISCTVVDGSSRQAFYNSLADAKVGIVTITVP